MFREMRRIKQQITQEECIEVLTTAPRGILALHGEDSYPYAIPMNHIYHENKLYFHSSTVGHKIDSLSANEKVSFCVMDEGYREDGEWPLHIKSVVIFGTLKKVEHNENSMNILRKLGMKHYPSTDSMEAVMKQAAHRVQMLELTIDHMTGKLVNES